jgi:hypothetical protein
MWLYTVITVYNVLTLDLVHSNNSIQSHGSRVKTLYTVITAYNHMDQELKHCTQ